MEGVNGITVNVTMLDGGGVYIEDINTTESMVTEKWIKGGTLVTYTHKIFKSEAE